MTAGREIERKFLVEQRPRALESAPATPIEQGYVAVDADGTEVRVRRSGGKAVLTFKQGGGRSRVEEEITIDDDTFERLWPLTEGRRIAKTRHEIATDPGLTIEVDVYEGALDGLVTAEIEFPTEAAADGYEPPPWLGREVTDDPRYKNQRLAAAGLPG